MADLELALELALARLGLTQYLDRLVQAGFDSWETLTEITEQDLDTLRVKLGHRRKLQREITNSRGLTKPSKANCASLPSPVQSVQVAPAGNSSWSPQSPSHPPAPAAKKRAYVHHPKPDANAPARPYSAYVLFSKAVREDLKSQPLSFTSISKEVGERWRRLTPEEKHGWRLRSAVPRKRYKADLAKYQQSDQHRHYLQYLSDFASAQAARRVGDPSPHGNAAASPPEIRPRSLAKSPETTSPPSFEGQATKMVDADGARVPRVVRHDLGPSPGPRPRAIHACDPCRQRKVKCDGERPGCGKCRHLNLTCSFAASRRDGKERTENSLWRKLNAYESILYRLIPRVGGKDRTAIESILHTPLPIDQEASQALKANDEMNGDGDTDGDGDGDTDDDADGEADGEVANSSWTPFSHLSRHGTQKISRDPYDFSRPSDQYPSPHSPDDQSADAMSKSFSPILSPTGTSTWQRHPHHPDSLEQQQQQQQQQNGSCYPGMIFDDITSVERDDFGFLQNPSVVNFYPTSIESAKNTEPGQEDELMMLHG